jgi:predicted transcriptional regulator
MSEDALSRATRLNDILAGWRIEMVGESTKTPLRVVEMLSANPFLTINSVAANLKVSFTTVQRAIARLERAGIVRQTSDAKRNRVWCANALLDILEEPAHLTPRPE